MKPHIRLQGGRWVVLLPRPERHVNWLYVHEAVEFAEVLNFRRRQRLVVSQHPNFMARFNAILASLRFSQQ